MRGSDKHIRLRQLEAEAIYIMREAVAEFRDPVMLYSIGKDFKRDATHRAKGISSIEVAVSAITRGHDLEVSANDRVPRRDCCATLTWICSFILTKRVSGAGFPQ